MAPASNTAKNGEKVERQLRLYAARFVALNGLRREQRHALLWVSLREVCSRSYVVKIAQPDAIAPLANCSEIGDAFAGHGVNTVLEATDGPNPVEQFGVVQSPRTG